MLFGISVVVSEHSGSPILRLTQCSFGSHRSARGIGEINEIALSCPQILTIGRYALLF